MHANGRVAYEIDADFTQSERDVIAAAIADIEAVSCVRWVPRVCDEQPHVRIKKDEPGCFATLGRSNAGVNNLGPGCIVRKKTNIIEMQDNFLSVSVFHFFHNIHPA